MKVYMLRNTVNGMAYIGATSSTMASRLSRHWHRAFREQRNEPLANAVREYGREAFEVTVLGEAQDFDTLMLLEIDAIHVHNTFVPHGYNMTRGGKGTLDRRHLESTRLLISAKTKGLVPWNAGKKVGPLSAEHRQKLSAIRQGKPAWNKGISHREDTKAKMSASHTGGKNWHASPIELHGVEYPSMMDAVRATGLSRMQVAYRLKTGRACYLDKRKD